MRLDLKRDALVLVPESDQDRAYIEDTLGLKQGGQKLSLERVADVSLGYTKRDDYVLIGRAPAAQPST